MQLIIEVDNAVDYVVDYVVDYFEFDLATICIEWSGYSSILNRKLYLT